MFGKWTISLSEYVEAVERYVIEVGNLVWAAPQDWMCEPFILEKTSQTVEHHQWQTIDNYLSLPTHLPFIPVLQGWAIRDYEAHLGMYLECGIDLTQVPVVGVGSVCRRQGTEEIGRLFQTLHSYGLKCHGFGVKKAGVAAYHSYMVSSDSMAWSYEARNRAPLKGCTSHINCANCMKYALMWREQLLALIDPTIDPPVFDYSGPELISQTATGVRLRFS